MSRVMQNFWDLAPGSEYQPSEFINDCIYVDFFRIFYQTAWKSLDYNGVLEAQVVPPVGSRGNAPGQGVGSEAPSPPEADDILTFET